MINFEQNGGCDQKNVYSNASKIILFYFYSSHEQYEKEEIAKLLRFERYSIVLNSRRVDHSVRTIDKLVGIQCSSYTFELGLALPQTHPHPWTLTTLFQGVSVGRKASCPA